ncbi:MAG: hypothetical protein KatS3mg035_1792 [Bacteroidia bacterium]|nr:MAG: hypothetical protein KatS3mg035_1792 [Bacteroidia bacterium]
MSLFRQMTQYMLNPVKGWPSQTAVDYTAPVDPTITYPIYAGRCCYLNNSGQLRPGAIRHYMGLFVFTSSDDFDVTTVYNNQWFVQIPQGNMLCFVAAGAYELQTTEFVASAGPYNINDPLRALGNSAGAADAGKLTKAGVVLASQSSNPASDSTAVVGIVSRPVTKNAYGRDVLSFWPVWYPGRATENE